LVGVWETLEETGALERFLPEWERVRLLPHASTVHNYTVDRHLVETCVAAASLVRRVSRPDLLLVAALLHDIGKGEAGDHSIAGAPVALAMARRMGFDEADAAVIEKLVRQHLLLPDLATTRDPEDPETVAAVVDVLDHPDELDLLAALTEADAIATSDKAWSPWRATMIRDLVARARAAMAGHGAHDVAGFPEHALVESVGNAAVWEIVDTDVAGTSRVRLTAPDRPGLLADAAATFALARVSVHAARVGTLDDVGVSEWLVTDAALDLAVLRQRFEAIRSGQLDVGARLSSVSGGADPVVLVRPGESTRATVLEIRFQDDRGTLFRVLRALAELDLTVVSARVNTFGPQAVDVFYDQEVGAGALSDERAAAAANGVRRAL
ncbi:MAG: ACT domain-containing protein, partial [Myxococcales bacterium]